MKKLLYILFILPLFSCNKDDTTKHHEFLERILGRYELRAAYTDTPVDLNHDGNAHTNLYEEVMYCHMSYPFGLYHSEFEYNSSAEYMSFWLEVPYSKYILELESYSTCLADKGIGAEYNVNEETAELSLVTNDYYNDFAAEYNTEFVDMDWEDDIAFFTLKKEFYNSSGEWQEVMLYMEFEKFMDYEIVY